MLHLRCVTQLTLVCILRYSGCSSLPIQSSVCYDIQNGSLCRSSFLYATLFQNASLCLSGVLYATLFKILPFTNLILYALRNSPQPGQGAIAPASVPLLASFLLSGLNAQPRLRILAGSASAGGVCFLEASPRRSRRAGQILSPGRPFSTNTFRPTPSPVHQTEPANYTCNLLITHSVKRPTLSCTSRISSAEIPFL